MSTVQRIAKNTAVLLVAQVANYLLAFFYIVYIARHLGAEGFGVLSFAIAFAVIFGIFADLGLQPLTVREVARDKTLAPKYLANLSLMKIILAAVTFGLIALTINLMGRPQQTINVVYLVGLSIIFMAFTQMVYSIFQAFERMEYQFLGQVLTPALILVGVILAIKYDFSVVGFASLYLYANAAVLVLNLGILRWKFPSSPPWSSPRMEMDWSFWKPTIKMALPFFLTAAFHLIAFRIDMVMLSVMKGDEVVGWYSAAYRLMEALMFIPAVFVISIYPVLSRFYTSSQESLKLAYQKSFKYLLLLGLPIAVGTTILADRIISAIFQEGFADSVIALQVLIWTIPIVFLNSMFGTVLASINRQGLAAKIIFVYMMLNVVMNLILIPRHSYVGASVATVVTGLVGFVLCFHFLSKLVQKIQIHKLILRPIVASGIMALFVVFSTELHLVLLIFVAAIIYFGILLLSKTFSKEDFDLLRQIGRMKQTR